jgi:hypothetical protein
LRRAAEVFRKAKSEDDEDSARTGRSWRRIPIWRGRWRRGKQADASAAITRAMALLPAGSALPMLESALAQAVQGGGRGGLVALAKEAGGKGFGLISRQPLAAREGPR